LTPLSRRWGKDRGGRPIDRYYIERFLALHAGDIRGSVLEAGDNTYTRHFGTAVTRSDVLHVEPGNPNATVVADLMHADHLPGGCFDCIILTQVLQFIAEPEGAVATLHRLLAPGGVLLVTAAGISRISRWEMDHWGEYSHFTTRSMRQLLERSFMADLVSVESFGNVLASAGFLYGLAAEELLESELRYHDPDYQLIVAARAKRSVA
jgi:SAM-dependent methyltransferase